MSPDVASETEQQRSARDFLRQMREHFRGETDPVRREAWVREQTQHRTREELGAITEHVNALHSSEIDLAERELVHRICTQQLRRFREQVQTSLSARDYVTLGAVGLGGGYLLYRLGKFFRNPIRNTREALRRPLTSLFTLVTGGLITAAGVFFSSATIERIFGRHAAARLNDAAGSVNPLGGVATGETVRGHNTADNPGNTNTGAETQNLPPATGATRERARTVFAGTPPPATGAPEVPAARRARIRTQLEAARTNNRPFSVVQAYELQAEEETDQLNTLLAARPPNPEAVRACRLRLTYIETISRALKQYGDLIDRYYGVRELCASSGVSITEPGKDAAIEAHIVSVLELAQARLQAGFGSAGNGALMDTAEANLWRSLQGERNNEGQTNATQGIPMVERTIELLQLRYAHLANAASRNVRPEEYGADGELIDMHGEIARHLRARASTEPDQEQKDHLLATATRLERGRMILRPDPNGLSSLSDRRSSVWSGLVNFNLPNFRAGSITQMFTQSRTLSQVGIQEAGLRELFTAAFASRTWPVTDGGAVRQIDAYDRYQRLAALRIGANSGTPLAEFKAQGAQNVAHLAGLHESLVSFQTERARLATLRHRTTTPGAPSGEQGIWGADNADLAARYDRFFVSQHTDAVDRLQAHTTMMDRDVLSVGPLDNAEHAWNKNGREFMVYLADNITKLQTFVLPDQVLGMQVNLRTMTREYLLGELPNLMGWPRKADGQLKDWGDFTSGEREAMRAKQESIVSCINRFQEAGKAEGNAGHYENFKMSTNLMKEFQTHSEQVQGWLNENPTEEPAIPEALHSVRVTSVNQIPDLATEYHCSKAAVIAACCDQFVDDTREYMTAYRGLVEGFHNVVGLHFEWAEAFDAFASKQIDLLLGWLLVCGAAVAAWIFRRSLTRLAARGARGASNVVRRPFVRTGATPRPGMPARTPPPGVGRVPGVVPEALPGARPAVVEPNMRIGALEHPEFRNLSPSARQMVARSPSAQNMFRSSIQANNAAEVAQLTRGANNAARGVRISGGAAVGMAMDAFGIYMAVCRYQEIGEMAKDTTNPALKDIYDSMQMSQVAFGSVHAVCFVINGVALFFPPAGLVTVPISIALMGVMYTSDKLYEVAIEWSKEEADWLKEGRTPAQILQRIQELGPGQPNFWQELGVLGAESLDIIDSPNTDRSRTFFERASDKKETANAMTRVALLRAYFRATCRLRRDTRDSDAQHEAKTRRYVSAAAMYMAVRQGDVVTGRTLEDAHQHAELVCISDQLNAQNQSYEITWRDAQNQEQRADLRQYRTLPLRPHGNALGAATVLRAYTEHRWEEIASVLNEIRTPPSGAPQTPADRQRLEEQCMSTIQASVLDRLGPYLDRINGRLMASESLSGPQKETIQFVLSQQLRFAMYRESARLAAQTDPITSADVSRVFEAARGVLTPNGDLDESFPALLQARGQFNYDQRIIDRGAPAQRYLTPPYLQGNMLTTLQDDAGRQLALRHPELLPSQGAFTSPTQAARLMTQFDEELSHANRMNILRMLRKSDYVFLKAYGAYLAEHTDMDLDGSARAAIATLGPDSRWEGFETPLQTRSDYSQRHDQFHAALRVIRRQIRAMDAQYYYFHPVNRDEIRAYDRVFAGRTPEFVVWGYQDAQTLKIAAGGQEYTCTQAQGAGQGLEIPGYGRVQYRVASGRTDNAWVFVPAATVPADPQMYFYRTQEYNGRTYEIPGRRVSILPGERRVELTRADGAYQVDQQIYWRTDANYRFESRDARYMHASLQHLRTDVQLADGTVLRGTVQPYFEPLTPAEQAANPGLQRRTAVRWKADAWQIQRRGSTTFEPITQQEVDKQFGENCLALNWARITGAPDQRPQLLIRPRVGMDVRQYTFSNATTHEALIVARPVTQPEAAPADVSYTELNFPLRTDNGQLLIFANTLRGNRPNVQPHRLFDGAQLIMQLDSGVHVRGTLRCFTRPDPSNRERVQAQMALQDISMQESGSTEWVALGQSTLRALTGELLQCEYVRSGNTEPPTYSWRMTPQFGTAKVQSYLFEHAAAGIRARVTREAARPAPPDLVLHPDHALLVPSETCALLISQGEGRDPLRIELRRGQPVPDAATGYITADWGEDPRQSGRQCWRIRRDNAALDRMEIDIAGQRRTVRFEYSTDERAETERLLRGDPQPAEVRHTSPFPVQGVLRQDGETTVLHRGQDQIVVPGEECEVTLHIQETEYSAERREYVPSRVKDEKYTLKSGQELPSDFTAMFEASFGEHAEAPGGRSLKLSTHSFASFVNGCTIKSKDGKTAKYAFDFTEAEKAETRRLLGR